MTKITGGGLGGQWKDIEDEEMIDWMTRIKRMKRMMTKIARA